ncbi:glutamate receptor ionotropic, NMDA 3A-like isoform X1 [Haliotis cracherodii]|uniref:glutamate receptor ionotropic, NMDA 3A-like isoform X1 n=1 Tax=Haliotis cracherodii TaxID=6455 RepID=UPI0039E77CC0
MHWIIVCSIWSVTSAFSGPQQPVINIGAVFDTVEYDNFKKVFYAAVDDFNNSSQKIHIFGDAVTAQMGLRDTISLTCSMLEQKSIHLFLVFGNASTIHSINNIAQYLGIPVMGYMTDMREKHVKIHSSLYLNLLPSKTHLASGLVKMMQVNYWYRFTFLLESDLADDGFYTVLREKTQEKKWHVEVYRMSPARNTSKQIENFLSSLRGNTSRIFVLHTGIVLAGRIFRAARKLSLGEQEFAWIITENAYTLDDDIIRGYPPGALAFLMNNEFCMSELLQDSISFIGTAFEEHTHVIKEHTRRQKHGCYPKRIPKERFHHNPVYRALHETAIYGKTGALQFDIDGNLKTIKLRVRNLVFDGKNNVWRDIGCVQGDDIRSFGIIWPGEANLISSQPPVKKKYRVVTNPVQPFVMQEKPHADYSACLTDTTCLNITSKNKSMAMAAIEDYERGVMNENNTYTVHCCRGLTIDLLNKLASDLDFDFTLYIVQDETYGRKTNGTWNGMMWDLVEGTAHFAVGAFSITRARTEAIDFTDPYFFSGFSILYSERTRETNMDAFLEPFSIDVWFAIFVSATLTAIAMGIFEWNSPFGLNPWGRKRKANYTLASGLTMVYSVLFGHTVKTKSPKAWPSKVMQNFWAFAAIFIIASYTANLAAFIAGKHAGIHYNDISDVRLQSIRVGVLRGSAVEEFLKKIQSKLVEVSSNYPVSKTDRGIEEVLEGKLDAYLGDYPILDYARAHLAPNCELKLLSQIFGDDRYGIGLPKGSPLKVALSRKIMDYHQSGYIDDLIDVHFADAQCFKQRITQEESRLEVQHHAGLFVMMSVGIIIGIIVCFVEHAVYKWLVPRFRASPGDSQWKSSHMLFFSQRLHRAVTSAELISAHDSAKEMICIVRNREFARLFQKSTIRKNKLADMAKTKRINRNFYDIVAKAKCGERTRMQEMKDNNLMDDSGNADSEIIEIPLKDLSINIERQPPKAEDRPTPPIPSSAGNHEEEEEEEEEEDMSHSQECLLSEASRDRSEPGCSDSYYKGTDDTNSSIPSLDGAFCDDSLCDPNEPPNNNNTQTYAACAQRSPPLLPNCVRLDSLPNGHLVSGDEDSPSTDNFANNRLENQSKLFKALTDDSHNYMSSMYSKSLLPKTNNMVRSLLHKTQSYQDHLCSADDSLPGIFCIEKISKEELLVMWKTSEIELNKRLEQALKEKARLERKLAQLQKHSPV